MKRLPKKMTIEELGALNTKRLLSYLKLLNQCEESFELSDQNINNDLLNEDRIAFKQTAKWKTAYLNLKSILKQREHIEK